MKLTVNGKETDFNPQTTENITVALLASAYGLKTGQYVTEINGEIIPKNENDNTTLKEGDIVELIRFVGGG